MAVPASAWYPALADCWNTVFTEPGSWSNHDLGFFCAEEYSAKRAETPYFSSVSESFPTA
jgi:hypothetical protein